MSVSQALPAAVQTIESNMGTPYLSLSAGGAQRNGLGSLGIPQPFGGTLSSVSSAPTLPLPTASEQFSLSSGLAAVDSAGVVATVSGIIPSGTAPLVQISQAPQSNPLSPAVNNDVDSSTAPSQTHGSGTLSSVSEFAVPTILSGQDRKSVV